LGVRERWKGTKPIDMPPDLVVKTSEEVLRKNPKVLIVYLFGSLAKDKGTKESDLDLAIYTTKDFSWDDYYDLYGELTIKLRSDRLDLIWLNMANPILQFEVIKHGKVLFYRDVDILNDYELKAKKNYYDYVIYLEKHRKASKDGL